MILITPSEVLDHAFTAREQITPQSVKIAKIITCCEKYIRPRFGDNLYDKFADGEYSTFVDGYLKPAIAHYVRYAIVDELSIQLSDNGAMQFDDREQESTQVRQNTLTHTSQNKVVGEDDVNTQLTVSSHNALKSTTKNDKDVVVELDKSVNENSKTVGETTQNQNKVIDRTTITEDEVNKTADAVSTSTVKTELEDIKERDYSFHESPQIVGVSTVGNSHDVQNLDNVVTTNGNANDVSAENSESSVKYNSSDTIVDRGETDETIVKTGLYTSAQHSIDAASETRNDETTAERQDLINRAAQTNRQSDLSGQKTSADDNEQSSTLRQRTAATDHQRQIIRARAFADASILIARAVRYVERNVELFPEYEPGVRNYGRVVI